MSTPDVLDLLVEQKDIISEAEEVTNRMLDAPAEELPELIALRGRLLEKAVEAEERIRKAAQGDKRLLEAADCSCEISELAEEHIGVFEAALRVKAAVNRICRLETDVLNRLNSEKEMALTKIEALNKSGNSVAANYKQAVQTGYPQDTFPQRSRAL